MIGAGIFIALAALTLIVYGGTPHGETGNQCGPINAFGHPYTVGMDCRGVSAIEIVVSIIWFALALYSLFQARPRQPL
jgi:hypothetical protein